MWPVAWPPPPPAPPRSRNRGLRIGLALLLVVALCAGLGDAVLVGLHIRAASAAGQAYYLGDESDRIKGLTSVLAARASAVLKHDEKSFLASVDQTDPSFVRRQQYEYQNLQALKLTSFALSVDSLAEYDVPSSADVISRRYDGAVWAPSVTVRYAISGLDKAPVAEPWVPLFAFSAGHWLLAGESDSDTLPTGAGGLPWEARPITVKRSAHVVAVVSANEQSIAPHLLDLAETGLRTVLKVRPTGWAGKILVTAVADPAVFQSYFRDSEDRVRDVAAIAVPTYNAVPEWAHGADFVTTRVIFNPDTLGDGDESLIHDLAHEFTHAAMGPLTTSDTPLWLVEGFAEYVGYQVGSVDDGAVGNVLTRIGIPDGLPDDSTFYDSADHYVVSWLACRLIAKKYGQAKLIALYRYFHDHSEADQAEALNRVLGVSPSGFVSAWRTYLRSLEG